MKVVTCLKVVPARDTRYQIAEDGHWIREADVTWEINECDEYALEEALKLQESYGGEVSVLTLGDSGAEKSIRKALAMGATRGLLILDEGRRAGSPLAVAGALAESLRGEDFDLVLTGTQSDDYGNAQVGVILAELLDLPSASIVMQVEVDPESRRVRALREMESGWFQWVEMDLPAVLTIQAGISQVRYPSLKGIMQAKKKEIRRLPLQELPVAVEELPRIEIDRLFLPESTSSVEMLQGDVQRAVGLLVEKLKKEAKVL